VSEFFNHTPIVHSVAVDQCELPCISYISCDVMMVPDGLIGSQPNVFKDYVRKIVAHERERRSGSLVDGYVTTTAIPDGILTTRIVAFEDDAAPTTYRGPDATPLPSSAVLSLTKLEDEILSGEYDMRVAAGDLDTYVHAAQQSMTEPVGLSPVGASEL
jgi:hypothetical protein